MYRYVRDGTYRVILSIVKAGCHTVAIAQVVKHSQLKSEAPGSILVQPQVAASFSQFSKNIPEPFHHVYVCTFRVCGCVSATRILPKSLFGQM